MSREELRENVVNFFELPIHIPVSTVSNLEGGSLAEALYTLSECGLWPDNIDSISTEQAIMCWMVIEKLRVSDFPENLWM
jgi:hypothetical protein